MQENIPPTKNALREAFELSTEILRNLELNEIASSFLALKASRLARLLNDFDMQKIFQYEAGGYPTGPDGVPTESSRLATLAGRTFFTVDAATKQKEQHFYPNSIVELEQEIHLAEASLGAARNLVERTRIRESVTRASQRLASRKAMIHELDNTISRIVPDAVQKLTAVYENIQSDNNEDWSNAVHSCRRILQDLADAVFPASDEERVIVVNEKRRIIKVGKDQYINRIRAFVESKTDSDRFRDLVGSQLNFLSDRLHSVFKAAQKGSHATIVSREEADRYVIYTYLILGDILSLQSS